MILPISRIFSTTYGSTGFEELNLDDYRVCCLLSPAVHEVVERIETQGLIVKRLVLTENWVRAYPDQELEEKIQNGYTEEPIPEGALKKAINLSYGPKTPFPNSATEEDQEYVGKLMRFLFPRHKTNSFGHAMLNHKDAAVVMKYMADRFSYSTSVHSGIIGVLHETEEAKSRHVVVVLSRSVEQGTIALVDLSSKVFTYEVSSTHVL